MKSALDRSCVIAVIGSGAMGAGIAQIAATAGHPVKMFDLRSGAAEQAAGELRRTLLKLAAKGRMSTADAEHAGARLQAVDSLTELADAGLVVEAIVENLDAKRKLFVDLEAAVGEACVLASNTSSISITSIAAPLLAPQRFLGMHFFNPAPLMALVEVVSGLATDAACAEIVFATAAAWGKSPVHTKSTPGFIVNRVARPYYAEALRLLGEEAGDVATIDAIMREAGGFRMGPFELMDLIGHDVNYAVTRSVFDAYYQDPRFTPSLIQLELVNAGYLGRKSGRGFYRHGAGAEPSLPRTESPSPCPGTVAIYPGSQVGQALADRLGAAHVSFTTRDAPHADARLLDADGCAVHLTDGRSATQRAYDLETPELALLDLALDPIKSTRIACSFADQASPAARHAVIGLLQAAGLAVSLLDDVPGLAVMRTVAMLANEAAEAVNQGVCDAAAVDVAMQKGVNYPRGPLAWADAIGLANVMTVLDHLARAYGEDRYRCSTLIRRKACSGGAFHSGAPADAEHPTGAVHA
jgi:3-hydroxybutyryl-CoA dehydrogenase